MKILYVGGFQLPDKNAAAQRVVNIAKALRDLGHEVIFLHNVKGIKKSLWTSYFGFKCYECDKKPISYNLGIKTIKKISKEEKIEAIIAYNYPSIALNKLVTFCKKSGIKSIADVTEWYDVKGCSIRSIIKRLDVEFRMTKVHPKMDGIIAISQYLYDYYKDKTHTIKLPPLVDLTDKKWGVDKVKNDVPTFVYAGSPSAQKEKLNLIINTIEDIAKEKPILLKVIGVTKSQYENMYSTKYDGKAVKFYGRIPHEEAIREVALSDWSIIIRENTLSNKAGFPTKFVESISCGTPVIANKFSNVAEYISSDRGILLDNINCLKPIIEKVMIDEIKIDNTLFYYHGYIDKIKQFTYFE